MKSYFPYRRLVLPYRGLFFPFSRLYFKEVRDLKAGKSTDNIALADFLLLDAYSKHTFHMG